MVSQPRSVGDIVNLVLTSLARAGWEVERGSLSKTGFSLAIGGGEVCRVSFELEKDIYPSQEAYEKAERIAETYIRLKRAERWLPLKLDAAGFNGMETHS
jgi:hypothetical protein